MKKLWVLSLLVIGLLVSTPGMAQDEDYYSSDANISVEHAADPSQNQESEARVRAAIEAQKAVEKALEACTLDRPGK